MNTALIQDGYMPAVIPPILRPDYERLKPMTKYPAENLYISDLDGTLLNPNAELSDFTRHTLNTLIADGLHFSVATARTWATVEKILSGLALPVPIVLMNGVLIYNTVVKEYIQICSIAPETVRKVIDVLNELSTPEHGCIRRAQGLMYELKDDRLITYYESLESKPLYDFVQERIAKYHKTFRQVDSLVDVSPDNIIYFMLLDAQESIRPAFDALSKVTGLALTMYKDIYSEDLWYLEIFSEKASKRNAVLFLKERFGYKNVIGFGDNLNDLPLFAACDHCYAVANAHEAVKEAADGVIESNACDGVVRWIEKNSP